MTSSLHSRMRGHLGKSRLFFFGLLLWTLIATSRRVLLLAFCRERSLLLCGSIMVSIGYLENFLPSCISFSKALPCWLNYWDFSLPHFLGKVNSFVKFHMKYRYISYKVSEHRIQYMHSRNGMTPALQLSAVAWCRFIGCMIL